VANSLIYAEDWAVKLQERLSEPVKWKDVCRVEYTDTKVLHNPYLSDATVQNLTRGTAYTMQDITETDESISIDTGKILAQFIDRGDLAQSGYMRQMELADTQGVLINEAVESGFLGDYASLTTFDNTELNGSAGNITVSSTNVDDIIRAVKRKIRVAGGQSLLERNGVFIIWRPTDLEILEGFMQANGFVAADKALQDTATPQGGFPYMGVTHYSSNLLTSGHLVAGVKKVYHLGILKSTFGQIVVDDKDPGLKSGISVVSRVDYKGKAWAKTKPLLFNITVA
jgi:hypothetical protein